MVSKGGGIKEERVRVFRGDKERRSRYWANTREREREEGCTVKLTLRKGHYEKQVQEWSHMG